MSDATAAPRTEQRLLTFKIGGAVHALPIACVVEVCEVAPLACIPTLEPEKASVMNHHGDALPVLRPPSLLQVDDAYLPEPTLVLVVTPRPSGGPRLGLPVDRIVGLVDGAGATSRDGALVAERRPIDGQGQCPHRKVLALNGAASVGRQLRWDTNGLDLRDTFAVQGRQDTFFRLHRQPAVDALSTPQGLPLQPLAG